MWAWQRCGFFKMASASPSLSLSDLFQAGYKVEREVDRAELVASNKDFIVGAVKPIIWLTNLYK